jgi:hypothetical protein
MCKYCCFPTYEDVKRSCYCSKRSFNYIIFFLIYKTYLSHVHVIKRAEFPESDRCIRSDSYIPCFSKIVTFQFADPYLVRLLVHFIYRYMVKVKLSLCSIKHHAMKAYGGVEVQLHYS